MVYEPVMSIAVVLASPLSAVVQVVERLVTVQGLTSTVSGGTAFSGDTSTSSTVVDGSSMASDSGAGSCRSASCGMGSMVADKDASSSMVDSSTSRMSVGDGTRELGAEQAAALC